MRKRLRWAGLGCGVLILLLVAFIAWWARNPIVFTAPAGAFPEVTARQLESSDLEVLVEAYISGNTEGYQVTEVEAPVELVEALGLGPPPGFVEEPLPLSEHEVEDPETVEWVNNWNSKNVRWVGSAAIHPNQPLLLRFPAVDPQAATGDLTISYERRGFLGGAMSATHVTINDPANRAEPQSSTTNDSAA